MSRPMSFHLIRADPTLTRRIQLSQARTLAARGLLAGRVSAGPAYEYIVKDQPAWLNVTDERGALISDAPVFIDGFGAAFNSLSGRYEVHGIETVDWNVPVSYAASVDGVMLLDVLLLSVMPNLADQDA